MNPLTSIEREAHFGVEDIEPAFLTRLEPNEMRNDDFQVHEVRPTPEPPLFLFGATIPRVTAGKGKAGTGTTPKRGCTNIDLTSLPCSPTEHVEPTGTRWGDAAGRTEKEFLASAGDAFPISTTGEPNEAVGEEEELAYTLESVANLEEGATPYEGTAGFDECEREIWGCALDGDEGEGERLCLESSVEGGVDWVGYVNDTMMMRKERDSLLVTRIRTFSKA